jgi:pimeloyl-ACP methyl ester carboxylesterase
MNDLWLTVAGLRLHGFGAGESGSPVLLLHGGGLDSASLSWRLVLPALAQRHRVYAFDWPGYGQSDSSAVTHMLDLYDEVLGQLLDALALPTVSLVGLSMGGAAALSFALKSPARVAKLVLVGSYGLQRHAPGGYAAYLFVRMSFLTDWTYALLRRSRTLTHLSLRGIVHDPRTITPELEGETFRLVQQPGAGRAFQSFQRHEILPDGLRSVFVERLAELHMPTLIVHGAHETLVPVAEAQDAARRLPNGRLEIFPNSAHWPPREEPERFVQTVLAFLAEQERP